MIRLCILGSTGSIGQSTLDVVSRNSDSYQVFALTANNRIDILREQCVTFLPQFAVVANEAKASILATELADLGLPTQVLAGVDSLCEIAGQGDVDTVVAAIVGAAGLLPTMAAVKAGKKILLANKESLVMAGQLFMQAVEDNGATLLPIDSEHNAIFQCLPQRSGVANLVGVKKIILSGSGGPFRTVPFSELFDVTPEQACNHPNWSMGKKISVDSATMMNKGLEFIEACWLFGVGAEKIEIIIHPQSIIHSMVEYEDGSIIAQLGNPDMRTPIAHALAWPGRISSGVSSLDLVKAANLVFENPNLEQFPCLRLAIEAAKTGQSAPIVLNAANEVAVDSFLNGHIKFISIAKLVEQALEKATYCEPKDITHVCELDAEARELTQQLLNKGNF